VRVGGIGRSLLWTGPPSTACCRPSPSAAATECAAARVMPPRRNTLRAQTSGGGSSAVRAVMLVAGMWQSPDPQRDSLESHRLRATKQAGPP
jgi:hypothetical protein